MGYGVCILKSLITPVSIALLVGAAGALAACGDNVDACDYNEQDDTTNATMPEMTGLTVSGNQAHVCGAFDGGHHDNVQNTVDVDTYAVDIETPGALLVEIQGEDGVEQLHDIAVQFLSTGTSPGIVAVGHYNPALSDHGAYAVTLPQAGTYNVQVILYDSGDLSAPIDYRLRLAPLPACTPPANPNYSEASDSSNGVVAVDYSKSPPFSMIAGDSPENSGITVNAGDTEMIAGNAGTTAAQASDEYLDRDTYQFQTSENTNELQIQLAWAGSASDIDFIVFEGDGSLTPVIAANTSSGTAGELAVFGVKPSTTYWLWVGSYMTSTAAADYQATICGQHFFY